MTDYKPTFDDVEIQWPPKLEEQSVADGDTAALIAEAGRALEVARDADLYEVADLLERLIESQPDLERVKREAGAAALREFVEALYEPGLIENHGGQDFVATSVIESLARSTTEKESDAE